MSHDMNGEKSEKKEMKPHIGIVNFEKRKHPRFSVDLPLEYYREDSPVREIARAGNASEGGLLVYFPEQVRVGDRLRLKLFFSSGSDLNTIEIGAEVVWVDMHLGKDWGDYRSGLKFTDISPENLDKLSNFLRNLSR